MSEFRVFRELGEARGVFGPSAVAIGNFDGVHRGHQAVFDRCVEAARRHGCKPSAMTFDPHPPRVLTPDRAPRLLSTVEQRCAWIGECGIVQVLIVPFTREFSMLSPEEFVCDVLVGCAGVRAVFVGENFHFGHRKAGSSETLRQMAPEHGFYAEIVSGVTLRGRVVSSSEIRSLIERGNVSLAARLLGRAYGLEGGVVAGRGIGSRETVPTLNLTTPAEVLPARGVYVTRTLDLDSGQCWNSVSNVGVRPTFGAEDHITVESFLLESPVQRPACIRVDFLKRLREERKFPDAATLRAQILRDVARAQAFHRRKARWRQDDAFTSERAVRY